MNEAQTTEVHQIKRQAAQGDVLVTKLTTLPTTGVKATNDRIIVASDAGHHHVIEPVKGGVQVYIDENNPLIKFVAVDADALVHLTHSRVGDPHAPLAMGEGVWELTRQREHTPDGWQAVQD